MATPTSAAAVCPNGAEYPSPRQVRQRAALGGEPNKAGTARPCDQSGTAGWHRAALRSWGVHLPSAARLRRLHWDKVSGPVGANRDVSSAAVREFSRVSRQMSFIAPPAAIQDDGHKSSKVTKGQWPGAPQRGLPLRTLCFCGHQYRRGQDSCPAVLPPDRVSCLCRDAALRADVADLHGVGHDDRGVGPRRADDNIAGGAEVVLTQQYPLATVDLLVDVV